MGATGRSLWSFATCLAVWLLSSSSVCGSAVPLPTHTNRDDRRASKFFHSVEKKTEGPDDQVIRKDELKDLLENSLGSEHFDDASEVADGVDEAFSKIDVGGDGSISLSEMTSFWSRLDSLQSVNDVADWVRYAVQLPQYEETFRKNAITGYDLPTLLEGKGRLLKDELGIQNNLHRRIITRSINTRLLGIGKLPSRRHRLICTVLPNCEGIELNWDMYWSDESVPTGQTEFIPIHLYRVKRRRVHPGGPKRSSWSDDAIVHSFPFLHSAFSDKDKDAFFSYKVQAWNLFGPSNWSDEALCDPLPASCEALFVDATVLASRENGNSLGGRTRRPFPLQLMKIPQEANRRTTKFFKTFEAGTDGENNMLIDNKEMEEWIRENIKNSDRFDEDAEIESAVKRAISNLDAGGDGFISPSEMTHFWGSLKDLRTVDHVVAWFRHALQLPHYEKMLREKSITGYMLTRLFVSPQTMKEKIGIEDELHLKTLTDILKIRLIGLRDIPEPVTSLQCATNCNRYKFAWLDPQSSTNAATAFQPHKYQVQSRYDSVQGWNDNIVGVDTTEFIVPTQDDESSSGQMQFRVRAWSSLGASSWSKISSCDFPPESCTKARKSSWANLQDEKDELLWRLVGAIMPGIGDWHPIARYSFYFGVVFSAWYLMLYSLRAFVMYYKSKHLDDDVDDVQDDYFLGTKDVGIRTRRTSSSAVEEPEDHIGREGGDESATSESVKKQKQCFYASCATRGKKKTQWKRFSQKLGLRPRVIHNCTRCFEVSFCKDHGYVSHKRGTCSLEYGRNTCLCNSCIDFLIQNEGETCIHKHVRNLTRERDRKIAEDAWYSRGEGVDAD
jgi:Ca2+-binding EF-hand superfamily protein